MSDFLRRKMDTLLKSKQLVMGRFWILIRDSQLGMHEHETFQVETETKPRQHASTSQDGVETETTSLRMRMSFQVLWL